MNSHNPSNNIAVLILMGGENKRMGGNHKAFLSLNGKKFLEHISSQMQTFAPVVLSINNPKKFDLLPYPTVVDEIKGIGPMGGIYSALKSLKEEHIFVTGCDMPFMTAEFARYLYTHFKAIGEPPALVLSNNEGKFHPLGGIYSKRLLPYIQEMLENKSYTLGKLLKVAHASILPISKTPFTEQVLVNINTPEEYAHLLCNL